MSSSLTYNVNNSSTISYDTYSSNLTYGAATSYISSVMAGPYANSNTVYQLNPTMVVPQTGTYYLPSGNGAWHVNG